MAVRKKKVTSGKRKLKMKSSKSKAAGKAKTVRKTQPAKSVRRAQPVAIDKTNTTTQVPGTPGAPHPTMAVQPADQQPPVDPSHAPGHRRLSFSDDQAANASLVGKASAAKERFTKGDRVKIAHTNVRRQINGRR